MAAKPDLPRWPTLHHERLLDGPVCGIDEAGMAPLAGPVVAAAVCLPSKRKPGALRGLNDSKLLRADAREKFFDIIRDIADVGVGMASVAEIDTLNIYHANLLAMQRAFEALPEAPTHALIDGRASPRLGCTVETLIKGDRRSLSIAAASVIAKVTRDRLMHELAGTFPDYGWETNVGYPTEAHYLGLLRRGPCEHHRRSFAPINTIFSPMASAWRRFRFVALERGLQIDGIKLFILRNDLHAVFDSKDRHVGLIKKLRNGWIFQAVGYDPAGFPMPGGGPCAERHGASVDQPTEATVERLLRGI